jgi:hypothetical protein
MRLAVPCPADRVKGAASFLVGWYHGIQNAAHRPGDSHVGRRITDSV